MGVLEQDIVSIIVPVYNVEKYLDSCITSILKQSYSNIEVILVNDGSTDNSRFICEKYAEKDNRVKVIHQKNSGPSVARNLGIQASSGKYIQFVDSDDYIDNDMTMRLIQAINNNNDIELVICGYKSIYRDRIQEHNTSIKGIYSISDFLSHFGYLYKESFINSPCNKLYTTKIIKDHNISFREKLDMGEDLLFNLAYIRKCTKINIINNQLYNYVRFNDNHSLTRSFQEDLFENQKMLFHNIRSFLSEDNNYSAKNKTYIELIYTNQIITCLENLFHEDSTFNSKNRRNQIDKIISDSYLREQIKYFRGEGLQKSLIGLLIKYRLIRVISSYFRTKKFIRVKMKTFFNFLKQISDNKGKLDRTRSNF